MGEGSNTQYRFGRYTLDPAERRILSEDGSRIELTAKAFDLLVLLASRGGQLVTKDEILDGIWHDVNIAESNVTTTISMIRKALCDDSEKRYIETVPKKGYRFVAKVRSGPEAPLSRGWPVPARRLAFTLILLPLFALGGGIWFWQSSKATSSESMVRTAVRLEAEGDDKLALENLNELLRANPNSTEALLRAAWLSYQADDDDDATQYLSRMTTSDSQGGGTPRAKATRLKGEGLKMLLAGNSDEALGKFDLASSVDSTNTDTLVYVADVATENGNLEKADDALAKCLKLDSLNPFCGFERIEALTYEGHYDQAIAEYERLIQTGSKYPWLDEPAGYAELAKGNVPEAQKHFEALGKAGHSLASAVHFRASQDGIATVDAYEGKRKEAHEQLESALLTAKSGYSKAAYFLLMAKIDILLGDRGTGKDDLLNVARLSHSGELAMSLARTFAMVGDFPAARGVLREYSGAAADLGRSYPAAEQFVDGLEALEKHDSAAGVGLLASSNHTDSSPETSYFTAQAKMQIGDWGGAIDSLKEILRDRGTVLLDGPAPLIPLAENDLSICYKAQAQHR